MLKIDPSKIENEVIYQLEPHRGESNALARGRLRTLVSARFDTSIPDRAIRQAIENLRTSDPRGAMICSSLSGGYYFARTLKELEKYLDTEERRFKQIAARISKQRKNAGLQVGGQGSFL